MTDEHTITDTSAPTGTIHFYNSHAADNVEVLRLSKDGLWANPDVPVDETAKLVLAAIDNNIRLMVEQAVKAERAAMMQLFTDPENQPTQHGTVTVEYMLSDPAIHYCHRFAILMESMLLTNDVNLDKYWGEAHTLLDEYNSARDKWMEAQGQPYVSGFGKD